MIEFLLAVDTAGARCSAALTTLGGEVLARREPEIGRGHAEVLMGLVADILAEAGASYRDIRKLAVVVGPGSFTGLRVGVAAVRGLGLALGVPMVGVSTLEAIAEPFFPDGPVLAVQDARRGELHAALFAQGGRALREPAAIPADGVSAFLEGFRPPRVAVGSGAQIAASMLPDVRTVNPFGHADMASVARIAAARGADAPAPRPLYLRGADAKPQAGRGRLVRPQEDSA